MKKPTPTKRYHVKANVQMLELTKAGSSMEFEIYGSAGKVGTVIIGRGSLTWIGSHKQKKKRIDWTRFAKLMDERA
jgi:hypothetical protein